MHRESHQREELCDSNLMLQKTLERQLDTSEK